MDIAHNQLLSGAAAAQSECPLFTKLPGEVRSYIYALTLTDYEDPNPRNKYSVNTCYTRPSYFAPRKTDIALLQTCRAIYQECWHLPYMLKEQSCWLTYPERAPPKHNPEHLMLKLRRISKIQGGDEAVISHLRIFAQMFKLEKNTLGELLQRNPFLKFRVMTLTIRHADWWFWERDEPLRFEGEWIQQVNGKLSDATQEVRIELETVSRKQKHLAEIAKQMAELWFFKRADGTILYADTTPNAVEKTTWVGSSVWNKERWIRDEIARFKIEYHVMTVVFRPEYYILNRGGKISGKARRNATTSNDLSGFALKLWLPGILPRRQPGQIPHEEAGIEEGN